MLFPLTSDMPVLKKQDGSIQVFEYDLTKDSLCDVADFIWDSV